MFDVSSFTELQPKSVQSGRTAGGGFPTAKPLRWVNWSSAHIESGSSAHIANESSAHRETGSSAHIERSSAHIDAGYQPFRLWLGGSRSSAHKCTAP